MCFRMSRALFKPKIPWKYLFQSKDKERKKERKKITATKKSTKRIEWEKEQKVNRKKKRCQTKVYECYYVKSGQERIESVREREETQALYTLGHAQD